jgi:hypothetical protein
MVFSALIGYFMYDGLSGSLAMIILCMVCLITMILSVIPFIGYPLQYLVSKMVVVPWVMSLTGIHDTWLTSVIFFIYLIPGAFFWFGMSKAVFKDLKRLYSGYRNRKITTNHS